MEIKDKFLGYVPPQATDAEKSVLGAILFDKELFNEVASILRPDMFYTDGHRLIFQSMKQLAEKGQPIDRLSLKNKLSENGHLDMVGGEYYLSTTLSALTNPEHVASHSKIIFEKWMLREIIRVNGDILSKAYNGEDPFNLIDSAQSQLSGVTDAIPQSEMTPISQVIVDALKQIQQWRNDYEASRGITGVPSGFRAIDNITRGWQPGDLIYLAARPSVGKTAFALNIARHAGKHLTPKKSCVAVWSLEMKSARLMLRMLAAEANEYLTSMQRGQLTDEQFKNLIEKGGKGLGNLNIFFDDTAGLTIQKLKTKCRRLKRKENLGLVLIDYLQLMTPDSGKNTNREQEVARISRALKEIALELQVPIIALSQLSREMEKANREPILSDLRESGSIEQDADMVMFLWSPNEAEIQNDASLLTQRFFKIAKQRDGMLLKTALEFKDVYQLFTEVDNYNRGPVAPSTPPGNYRPILPEEKDLLF